MYIEPKSSKNTKYYICGIQLSCPERCIYSTEGTVLKLIEEKPLSSFKKLEKEDQTNPK